MNSYIDSARYKLEKYGEIRLDETGHYSVPHKFWTITPKQMAAAASAGHCRIDTVGESTFAVYLKPEGKTP